mgnify:CR=1 FL=1
MILVEVQVPVLNRRYDFELDEESLVADLTELVAELIREKEGLTGKRRSIVFMCGSRSGSLGRMRH